MGDLDRDPAADGLFALYPEGQSTLYSIPCHLDFTGNYPDLQTAGHFGGREKGVPDAGIRKGLLNKGPFEV
jgi:hypothetical protein